MNITLSRVELQEVAKYHRLLLWSLLAAIAANLSHTSVGEPFVSVFIVLTASVLQIFALYNLGKSLKLSTTSMILFMISLFIPLIGLLTLLLMHDKAMKVMKAAGIKVGFMGADPSSI